jgi:hypothetical protein
VCSRRGANKATSIDILIKFDSLHIHTHTHTEDYIPDTEFSHLSECYPFSRMPNTCADWRETAGRKGDQNADARDRSCGLVTSSCASRET